LPIYIGIKGKVYDVTKGKKHYGKGGGYNGFAGRDATRAFLNLCFSPECLATADDLTGMSEKDMQSVDDWVDFFENDPKYFFVGYIKKEKEKTETKENTESKEKIDL